MNRRATRDQRGLTLLELLVALVVSTAVVVPLVAWMTLAYGQQADQTVASRREGAEDLLLARFPRDVNSASSAAVGGTDCTDTDTATSAGPRSVLITLNYDDNGNGSMRTLYTVSPEGSRWTLWRRRCDGAGLLVDELQLGQDVTAPPGGWGAAGSCDARNGFDDSECGRVSVRFADARGRVVTVDASLRTGPLR